MNPIQTDKEYKDALNSFLKKSRLLAVLHYEIQGLQFRLRDYEKRLNDLPE